MSVHCPKCDKKMAEYLKGTIVITCPRCKTKFALTREDAKVDKVAVAM